MEEFSLRFLTHMVLSRSETHKGLWLRQPSVPARSEAELHKSRQLTITKNHPLTKDTTKTAGLLFHQGKILQGL